MPQPSQNGASPRHFGPSIRPRHLRTSYEHMMRRDAIRREHCRGTQTGDEMWRFFVLFMFWPRRPGPSTRQIMKSGARRSVSRVLSPRGRGGWPFIWDVRRRTPRATNPGGRRGNPPVPGPRPETRRPYSVLLPVGFAVPATSPPPRCALTAPFHPCPPAGPGRPGGPGGRSALCGTFPGVAPAGRYPAPCFRGARTFLPPAKPEGGHPTVWRHKRRKVRARARQAGASRARSRARRSASRAVSGSATPSTRRGRKWR